MALAFALVAFIFAVVVLIRSKGENLLGWATLALSAIHLMPLWPLTAIDRVHD